VALLITSKDSRTPGSSDRCPWRLSGSTSSGNNACSRLDAEPIACLPQRYKRLHHLGAIAPAMVRLGRLRQRSAWLHCGHGLGPIEQPQQGLAVVPGELLQLIEEPPLADGRQLPWRRRAGSSAARRRWRSLPVAAAGGLRRSLPTGPQGTQHQLWMQQSHSGNSLNDAIHRPTLLAPCRRLPERPTQLERWALRRQPQPGGVALPA
jgi:hypothetical protein